MLRRLASFQSLADKATLSASGRLDYITGQAEPPSTTLGAKPTGGSDGAYELRQSSDWAAARAPSRQAVGGSCRGRRGAPCRRVRELVTGETGKFEYFVGPCHLRRPFEHGLSQRGPEDH
jgi:hypothetical protein